ncbi:flagellar hook-associated protein 2 [Mammaliicoccus sciuri]
MRIGGLASGMDTETIIRDMMKAHRIPLDKITQKKQYTTWQMEDYRSVNRDLKKLSDKLLDNSILQKNYLHKTVNVSDENAASIRSVSGSSDFSGTLEIDVLATQATLQSGELKSGTEKITDETASKKTLKELGLANVGATLKIEAPGREAVDITIEESDTMTSLMKKINDKTGVNAFFDSASGKIAMSAKNSGEGNIKITGDADSISKLQLNVPGKAGIDAEFTFNGLKTTRPSNTFEINGFEVTLKQTTSSPITFSSSADSDKIVDSITEFVNDYNEMIEKLNSKIKEKNFRDFHPLSAEQKADMKEKEIELWEEKAKSGTLRNDPAISSMLSSLRGIMSKVIKTTDADGKEITISLKDIGIEPSNSYSENGKLIINEDKLRAKIAENPNAVYDLIGRDDKDTKGVHSENNSGIAQDYRKALQDVQKNISAKAGSSTAVNDTFALGRSLKSFDKQIERFENKLQMMESRYWKQFSAMERAIQRANAQSAQLMNSFGGGM